MNYYEFPFLYEKKKPLNEPLPLYQEIEVPLLPLPKKEEEIEKEPYYIIQL